MAGNMFCSNPQALSRRDLRLPVWPEEVHMSTHCFTRNAQIQGRAAIEAFWLSQATKRGPPS